MNHNLIILSQFTLKDKTIVKPTTAQKSKCLKCYFQKNEKSLKKKFLDNIWSCLKEI